MPYPIKKIHIVHEICVESKTEASFFKGYFINNGYLQAKGSEDADVILVFSCGFMKQREEKWLEIIKKLNRDKKEHARLIVCGCLPKINEDSVRSVFDGLIVGPYEVEPIRRAFNFKQDFSCNGPIFNSASAGSLKDLFPSRGYAIRLYCRHISESKASLINVSTGCLGHCSFCAIKLAKPVLKSNPIEEILRSINSGLEKEYKNFILSSDDIGSYGQDIGTNYADLLERIINIPGDFRLELRYLEPNWLIRYEKEILGLLKGTNKISYICIPVQSGSNMMLRQMNREYEANECINAINKLTRVIPSAFVRTHFMVGFPGESEEDFKMTVAMLDKLNFDVGQCWVYTDRPNTRSIAMTNKVPEQAKILRKNVIDKKMELKTRVGSFIKYYRYAYYRYF